MPGRIEKAVRYADEGQAVIASGGQEVLFAAHGLLGSTYLTVGQPQRNVEWCRTQLACGRDNYSLTRGSLVFALAVAGSFDEAKTAANGLIDAAEATHNPFPLLYALFACGTAFRDADPDRARDVLQRGLVIAQDSGNRAYQSHIAVTLARLEADYGPPLAALEYASQAIRTYHDSGNTSMMGTPLVVLATLFHRLRRHLPAATIAGFALNPFTEAVLPEFSTAIAHLREVLGDQTYESLARKGETMTIAEIVTYAYNQIDQARAELNTVAK